MQCKPALAHHIRALEPTPRGAEGFYTARWHKKHAVVLSKLCLSAPTSVQLNQFNPQATICVQLNDEGRNLQMSTFRTGDVKSSKPAGK